MLCFCGCKVMVRPKEGDSLPDWEWGSERQPSYSASCTCSKYRRCWISLIEILVFCWSWLFFTYENVYFSTWWFTSKQVLTKLRFLFSALLASFLPHICSYLLFVLYTLLVLEVNESHKIHRLCFKSIAYLFLFLSLGLLYLKKRKVFLFIYLSEKKILFFYRKQMYNWKHL